MVRRLSKNESLGFYEPVCNKCYQLDHKSCQACGRYRKLTMANDGRLLCKICIADGEKACEQCNRPMPAGHGKICKDCYYKNLLAKRTQICIEALSNQLYVNLFVEFSVWLENDTGVNKAAITLNKHFAFFQALNIQYPDGIPNYCDLLECPEKFHLRTNSLPMRFLCATKRMVVDFQAKDEEMNRLIIQNYLKNRIGIVSLDRLFDLYYQHLTNKKLLSQTTFLSIRLALRPALKLLSMTASDKKEHLDQAILSKLLSSTPGQYAAIYGFVMFCKKHGEHINMPNKITIAKSNTRLDLERQLISHIKRNDDIFSNAKFRVVALGYFHHMPLKIAKMIAEKGNLVAELESLFIDYENARYFLPIPNA